MSETDFTRRLNRKIQEALLGAVRDEQYAVTRDFETRLGEVRKLSTVVSVSCCELTDTTGEDHCTHPPYTYPPVPRLRRLKWKVRSWWSGLRMRVGSWIAGTNLEDDE